MEVGQGPNWGCSAKGEKLTRFVTTRFLFVWGYIKDSANDNNLYNLDGLKTNISNHCQHLTCVAGGGISVMYECVTWWCTVSELLVARCIVDT
jgi:hypothetical protein